MYGYEFLTIEAAAARGSFSTEFPPAIVFR